MTILPCLREFVVIDQPQTMTYVNEDAPERWGVDPELIFATARANLAATAPAPDVDPDDGPAILRFVGVEYAEALPLLDGWLASYAGQLGGTPVAFMPGDGTLLLVSGTEEQIGDMLSFIESEYAEAEKPLSPMAYTVDGAGVLIPYPFRWGNPGSAAVMRAAVRLATTEYAYQKEVLDEHHDGETIDIFVPTVMLSERTDGALLTVSTWGEGVDTLLPQTDLVAFASDHEESFMVSWAVLAARVVLVPEPGLDPPRYRVRGWPPPDVVAELRRFAE